MALSPTGTEEAPIIVTEERMGTAVDEIVTAAVPCLVTPFRVALTKTSTVPATFPAITTTEGSMVELRVASELLRNHA